jgi:hypothetical protein
VPTDPRHFRDALDEVRRRAEGPVPGLDVEACLREGDPAEEVLRAADDVGCDLIVLGSHGRSGLGRLLCGSVAEAVMRRAPCPVLVVKGHAMTAQGAADRGPARQSEASPAAAGSPAAPPPARLVVTEGRCVCGMPTAHVHHRDFPEHWTEGASPGEAAATLAERLNRARESCPSGWHRDGLSRAIDDLNAFRGTLSEAGGGQAKGSQAEGPAPAAPLKQTVS